MIPPKLIKWKNLPRTEGLLFFAQSICELLYEYSLDSYKVPALNLRSSVQELGTLYRGVLNERIKKGVLSFSIEELKQRIKNDIVFDKHTKKRFENKVIEIENLLENSGSRQAKEKIVVKIGALYTFISDSYWLLLKERIKLAITDGRQKKLITKLTLEFSTELENRGYAREYIFAKTKKFFFSENIPPKQIDCCCIIDSFFSKFETEQTEWKVVFKGKTIPKEFIRYARRFNITIKYNHSNTFTQKPKYNNFIGKNKKYKTCFIVNNIHAKDPHRAREKANFWLECFADVCRFHSHKTYFTFHDAAYSHNLKTDTGYVIKRPAKPMECGAIFRHAETQAGIETTLNILSNKYFAYHSFFNFLKVLDFHHAAMESNSYENQLLDMWAALEGFLPTPSSDTDRIHFYIDSLMPALTLKYTDKIFRYLTTDILQSGEEIVQHIEAAPVESSFMDKVVHTLTSEDLCDWKETLFQLLECHPLLRYRCFTISESYSTTHSIMKTLTSHKDRLKLHIQRIYTLRNQIMHNAETFPYIRTLVENLHDYLDTLILSVSEIGKMTAVEIDIPVALEILSSLEHNYIEALNTNIRLNSNNCIDYIFGSDNLLSRHN